MSLTRLRRFAAKIKQLTQLSNVTQVELSKRLGIQPSHLNIFFQGRGDIHGQRLIELLLELGVDVESQIDEALARFDDKEGNNSSALTLSGTSSLATQFNRMSRAERESISLIIRRLDQERGRRRGRVH